MAKLAKKTEKHNAEKLKNQRHGLCTFFDFFVVAFGARHLAAGSLVFNGLLPLVVPFGHPKGTEKVPATSDRAGGPA